jgi:hypothetical protein
MAVLFGERGRLAVLNGAFVGKPFKLEWISWLIGKENHNG